MSVTKRRRDVEGDSPEPARGRNPGRLLRDTVEALRAYGRTENRVLRQSALLYGSYLAVIVLSIGTGSINARFLGPGDYGNYAFILSVASFVGTFFSFGFFRAGQRVIAHASSAEDERELFGGTMALTLIVAVAYGLFLFGLSFFIDRFFGTSVGIVLRLFSIGSVVLPFGQMLPRICVGANRISERALLQVLPKILQLAGAVCLVVAGLFNLETALTLYFGAWLIAVVPVFFFLNPAWSNMRNSLRRIIDDTRLYGWHVYLGAIADLSTYELDKMFIVYFVDTTTMGFYRLAAFLCGPMRMMSTAISETLFKRFASLSRLPRHVVIVNTAWLGVCFTGLVVFGGLVVRLLFSRDYDPVIPLILPLALSMLFAGMYQPYHFFLSAKGCGRQLKRISIIQAVFNTVGNVIFIMKYGAMGAAWVSAAAKALECALNVYYYHEYVKKREDGP